jgi:pyrimidine operon attenuation protein/uracil phosphoribosyltransferase
LSEPRVVLDEDDIRRTLVRIAHEIVEKNAGGRSRSSASTAAARTSPRACTARLRSAGDEVPLGDIDIAFYRDDLATPRAPVVPRATCRSGSRTTPSCSSTTCSTPAARSRAGIDALFDYGPPARVQLAVLADRGHRELPIRPDYVGKNLPTPASERVNVRVAELDGVDEVADRRRWQEALGVRHLLSIEDLDRAAHRAHPGPREVVHRGLRARDQEGPALRGRRVLNLFYEASTRTRSRFELAAKSLSADVINFVSSGSSVEKGESLKDTVQTLSAISRT